VLVDFVARIISQLHVLGRNAIFGHVARLPDDIPAHQAIRQVELSVGRPPDPAWKRPPGRPRAKWTDQLCRDNNNVPIATLWRQAIGRGHSTATLRSEPTIRVNDDDGDDFLGASTNHTSALCAAVVKTDCMHEVGPPSPISGRVNVSVVARVCPTVAPRINNAFSRLL